MRIAFLVYTPKQKQGRRKSSSFDWSTNAGGYMIIDCLQRAGYSVSFCSPETAKEHDVVLVSLTSTFDIYNLISDIGRLASWRKGNRTFKVIAGGFGLQNIYPLRNYVDYGVFGRGENIIVPLVQAIERKRDFLHESVMVLEHGVYPVKVAQAEALYPYELDTKPVKYKETEIGCPRKCYFCHYSFSRRNLKIHESSFLGAMGFKVKEVLFDKIFQDSDRKNKIRTALDGFSERLRFAFNKRLSNELIVQTVERASREWLGKSVWVSLYHIGSYPTETDEDREEFKKVLETCNCTGKKVYIDVHVTPFRPSPLTPSAYLPANLSYDWSKKSNTTILIKENLKVGYMLFIESPFSLLQSLVAERATEKSDDIINTICFSKQLAKLKVVDKVYALSKTFDLTPYTREYHTKEKLSTWYLESYTPQEKVKEMARKLKKNLGMPEDEKGGAVWQDQQI
jgi:radical SAM superfamily enzyme YgiQ (UPF0313 family)